MARYRLTREGAGVGEALMVAMRESSPSRRPRRFFGMGDELFGGVTDALKQDWLLLARRQRAGNNNVSRSP
jgi:hypothetical protein